MDLKRQLLDAPPEGRPLLFLHIRKTAGCSVNSVLFNRFPADACLLDAHHVGHEETDPNSYQFVTGHVGFDYVARFAQRPFIVTFLRRPVERALSAYYFFRQNDKKHLQWLKATVPAEMADERLRFTQRANELTLLEFLERETALGRQWLSNVQTHCLLGEHPRRHGPFSDAESLEVAKKNLESCDVIGLTEQFEESIALLGHTLGFEGLRPTSHDNKTPGRPAADEVDPRALEILTSWNFLDAELYSFAEQLFKRRPGGPSSATTCLPHAAHFTFDQPIHGRGWYRREQYNKTWICWMGVEQTAWIDLQAPSGGDCHFQCDVAHVLRASILDGLRIHVNDEPLAVRRRAKRSGLVLDARIPARVLENNPGRTRIVFSVNETVCPNDLVPNCGDERKLGIALKSIQLTRAAA